MHSDTRLRGGLCSLFWISSWSRHDNTMQHGLAALKSPIFCPVIRPVLMLGRSLIWCSRLSSSLPPLPAPLFSECYTAWVLWRFLFCLAKMWGFLNLFCSFLCGGRCQNKGSYILGKCSFLLFSWSECNCFFFFLLAMNNILFSGWSKVLSIHWPIERHLDH